MPFAPCRSFAEDPSVINQNFASGAEDAPNVIAFPDSDRRITEPNVTVPVPASGKSTVPLVPVARVRLPEEDKEVLLSVNESTTI